MIYLIDDKKIRQEEYSWKSDLLNKYKQVLTPVYNVDDLEKIKKQMWASDDIILYHDSFFENPVNHQDRKKSSQVREALIERSQKAGVVFFGGAIGSRTISNNYASIPVSILYNNLEAFLNKYIESGKNNKINLRYLLFGLSFDYEEIVLHKEEIWKLLYSKASADTFVLTYKIEEHLESILDKIQQTALLESHFKAKPSTVERFKYDLSKLIKSYINE